MPTLDLIDYKIIALLQEDGRRPALEIARQLDTSEATIRRRIERLIENDVIRIAAVSDPIKLGFPEVLIVGVKVERSYLSEAATALASLNEVRFVAKTTGRYDLIFEAWLGSNEQILEFLTEKLGAIRGIGDIDVIHVHEMVKYVYDWGKGDVAQLSQEILGK